MAYSINQIDQFFNMYFFIPPLGTEFKLKQDWIFDLHTESRNADMWRQYFKKDYYDYDKIPESKQIGIPVNSELKVDRIYIRQGQKDFNSVTFRVKFPGEKKSYRFWAKLDDVNKIGEVELL